jgi:hypothetical protein
MLKRSLAVLLVTALALAWARASRAADSPARHTKVILSKALTVDGIIKSMEGPYDFEALTMMPLDEPEELIWLTGFKSEIVQEDGATPALSEFMCHTNLDFEAREYWNRMLKHRETPRTAPTVRMFTLSQGAFSAEFPPGFGYPMSSHQKLSLFTQVLNHNEKDINTKVRHRVTITYVRDRDVEEPMIPLYSVAPQGLKLLSGDSGHFNVSEPDESKHGPSCLPGLAAPSAFPGSLKKDKLGRKFTGHWVVEPGVEENHTNVTHIMQLPYDTTLHYANVHLHPFAEFIELRDITAGETILRSEVKAPEGRIGITRVDDLSSVEGLPLYKDHEYEIVSRYNNTSGVKQDAMATVFLYLRDKGFDKTKVRLGAGRDETRDAGAGMTSGS